MEEEGFWRRKFSQLGPVLTIQFMLIIADLTSTDDFSACCTVAFVSDG